VSSALLMINRLACDRGLVLERPNALSARMIRNGNRHLGDVVFVAVFGERSKMRFHTFLPSF
jgi:hypothetical protein